MNGSEENAINEAIKLEPNDPRAYNKRCMIYQEMGQAELALADIERAIRLDGKAAASADLSEWLAVVDAAEHPIDEVTIAVVGKYVDHKDAYKSVGEALKHGGIRQRTRVNLKWIESQDIERDGAAKALGRVDGILVPGGFGDRGTEGKIAAARFARENGVPYYGLCLGLQIAVIEFARNVLKLSGANSTEFDPRPEHPVINMMEEQKKIIDKGATMRLGSYECALTPGTLAHKAYGADSVRERHRHRYEVNNAYRDQLAGLPLAERTEIFGHANVGVDEIIGVEDDILPVDFIETHAHALLHAKIGKRNAAKTIGHAGLRPRARQECGRAARRRPLTGLNSAADG